MHPRAAEVIRGLGEGEPLAIACSGGADSVALLLAVWANFPERRKTLEVMHFNHRLRGVASDEDEAFVRSLARALGVPVKVGRWNRPKSAPPVSEAAARGARMAFFAEMMAKAGARTLATGHQLDDVAETMLMRLARGSGAGGLCAPRPVQSMADGTRRIRPLLNVRSEEVRSVLRSAGASWREDDSNATDLFFRNRVRRLVIPSLEAASPTEAVTGFAASRALLEEDDEALDVWLREVLGSDDWVDKGDLSRLRGRPAALARRAVHAWLRARGLSESLGKSSVNGLVAAVTGGADLQINAGSKHAVFAKDGQLAHAATSTGSAGPAPTWCSRKFAVGDEVFNAFGDSITMRKLRVTRRLLDRLEAGSVDVRTTAFVAPGDDWSGVFGLRTREPGDRMRPLGAPGRAKLQDLLVNRKVPRELRDRLPVIMVGKRTVVWVPGLPPADEFAVQRDSKTVVQLTYTRASTNIL